MFIISTTAKTKSKYWKTVIPYQKDVYPVLNGAPIIYCDYTESNPQVGLQISVQYFTWSQCLHKLFSHWSQRVISNAAPLLIGSGINCLQPQPFSVLSWKLLHYQIL